MKHSATDLEQLPGVGPRLAALLHSIGVRRIADLKNKDPEELYDRLCRQHGKPFDRCVLYVFRCAVYAASTPRPKPGLLQWWKWKDRKTGGRRSR